MLIFKINSFYLVKYIMNLCTCICMCSCLCLRAQHTAKLVHINNDCLFFLLRVYTLHQCWSGDRHTLLCTHKYTAHTHKQINSYQNKQTMLFIRVLPSVGLVLRRCVHKSKRQMYYYCMRILYLYIQVYIYQIQFAMFVLSLNFSRKYMHIGAHPS